MITNIALSLFGVGMIGLIIILSVMLSRTMKEKKVFGIGSLLLGIIFTVSLGLGIFILIDNRNNTKITERFLSTITGKAKTVATQASTDQKNKKQDIKTTEIKKEEPMKAETKKTTKSDPTKTNSTNVSKVSKPIDLADPIQILKCYLDYGYIDGNAQYIVHYELKNISKKNIDAYTTTTVMFDVYGEPVMYYKTRGNFINHLHDSYGLDVGQVDTMVTGDVLDTTKKVKGIIMKVHFTDGTVWQNPKWNEFMNAEAKHLIE